jgi:ribulose-5-phosphate 4-epimerase/fuculose-1-phosphate aldolase
MHEGEHTDVGRSGDDPRHAIARACRALVAAGVLDGILGHVSVRHVDQQLWVRCRGPEERGLRATLPSDIHLVGLDGSPPLDREYAAPNELPIHTAIMKAHREVQAVVHAHPPYALIAGLAELDLLPLFGAYNIPAMRLAADGIGVYPRAVLVDEDALGLEMVGAMDRARVGLLRGHGIVATGASLEEAVVAAVDLETLCRVTVELHRLGVRAKAIPTSDQDQLPDLGRGFNAGFRYRQLLAELDAEEVGSVSV